jgi:hypothetical protein
MGSSESSPRHPLPPPGCSRSAYGTQMAAYSPVRLQRNRLLETTTMRAVSSVAHQPHLGYIPKWLRSGTEACGFTFPLFLFRCRGSARYLHHAIMQSCNHVIRRISLWPLIGGEPRSPYPTQAEGKPPCPPVHLPRIQTLSDVSGQGAPQRLLVVAPHPRRQGPLSIQALPVPML